MTDFYKELKSIRVEKDIELEGIHKRTKISLSALRAIEKGMFDQLPHTYVLFFSWNGDLCVLSSNICFGNHIGWIVRSNRRI